LVIQTFTRNNLRAVTETLLGSGLGFDNETLTRIDVSCFNQSPGLFLTLSLVLVFLDT
jgi:hypothetical protein